MASTTSDALNEARAGRILTLPLSAWPHADREAWNAVREGRGPGSDLNRATSWSPARCEIIFDCYGQYLAWLARTGQLDLQAGPLERITPERVSACIAEIRKRLAPVSVVTMVGGLHSMVLALDHPNDWVWLRQTYYRLRTRAVPVREKRARVLPVAEICQAGVDLMVAAERSNLGTFHKAAQFRDGLMLAFLAARPLRLKNFTNLDLGRSLIASGGDYRIEFSAEETKMGRPIDGHLVAELVPWLEHYLRIHRPLLLARRKDKAIPPARALWISRKGLPMAASAIRMQILVRTEQVLGRPINPHLFRDCAATSIAEEDPEHVRIIASILGHAKLSTAERYYNHAGSLTATRTFAETMVEIRRRFREAEFDLQRAASEQPEDNDGLPGDKACMPY